MNIACALRWGVASVGMTLLGMAHPIWDTTFQVRDTHWWTTLIRGYKGEESRLVAFIILFVIFFLSKLVLVCIFM